MITRLLVLVLVFACNAQETRSADTINEPFTLAGARVEPDSINAYLAAHRGFTSRGGEMRCAYRPLGQRESRVFVWALCSELSAVDGHLVDGSAMSLPAAFEITVDSGKAHVVGVEVPADGDGYASSIRRIFPERTWPAIFATRDRVVEGLEHHLRVEAASRFGLPPAAADAPRRHDPLPPVSDATLDSSARRVVEFLRGKALFDKNVTFVFDTGTRPRIVAALYDQREW